MIISTTAQQRGRGTDVFKTVSWLTKVERDAARSGELVMFRSRYLSGGRHGTYWRRVLVLSSPGRVRYVPRVPSEHEINAAEHLEQVNGQEGAS